ncbi:MAG: GDP-mannose 4,6-dehydratase, partial [Verrucomicrobiota bacterium]|nr:GDP-mannose 4,6-dehydratase [Verrucomicrobiota bacterium]
LYNEVNIQGTLRLLEIARHQGIKKFVFGSSSSVYGINAKVPFSESDPIFNAISPYAATKLAGEALCHVYHHLYGIDIPCLRFFTVYGPRQRPDLAIHKFTKFINEGRPIQQFGDGSTKRDYTFVTDIVEGICAALYKPVGYEIFNLGNSHPTPLLDLIGLIERNLGKVAKIEYLPEQPGDVPITFADVSKAKDMLGYEPQVLIEEGIARFVEWFLEQNG